MCILVCGVRRVGADVAMAGLEPRAMSHWGLGKHSGLGGRFVVRKLGRNHDIGRSIDASGVINRCRYGLITRSVQSKAVGPRAGTCIRRSEAILTWKDGGWIGTGKAYEAVDNCIPPSANRCGHSNGKGGTYSYCGRSCELKNCVWISAAGGQQDSENYGQCE